MGLNLKRELVETISLILLAAGNSTRFGLPAKKQWLYQNDIPLWLFVAKSFENTGYFKEIIIVGNKDELKLMQSFANYKFTAGGNSRQESLKNALESVNSEFVMVNDVARCCLDESLLKRLLNAKKTDACAVPAIKVSDTVYYKGKPINRDELLRIQTPQLSHTATLKEVLNGSSFTDESSAFYANGKEVVFVEGSSRADKLTYKEDLKNLPCLCPPASEPKSGFGIDIHPFQEGKEMVLCGVKIDSDFGFKAHSDGDVGIHALIDALLGASSLGDIGGLFPDTDEAYAGADSKELLAKVTNLVKGVGYEITHCDISIVAQVPKISPYKLKMQEVLAEILGISKNRINIKATTAEKMGFIGRKEGVAVYATVTLNYFRWDKI